MCFTLADNPPTPPPTAPPFPTSFPHYDALECYYCSQTVNYASALITRSFDAPPWNPNYLPTLEGLVCDIDGDSPTCLNVTDTVGTLVWTDYQRFYIDNPCKYLPGCMPDDIGGVANDICGYIDDYCHVCDILCPLKIPLNQMCNKYGCP